MTYITYYLFRVNGEVVSTQTYNGNGTSDYASFVTAPSGYDNQQGFSLVWDFDNINSYNQVTSNNVWEYFYYYDATYFYNDPNYVTCNFLYADNGEFANITATNGSATSNFIGFGSYLQNSVVSITAHPRPGYSITGIEPSYEGTWATNKVYRLPTVEGARITWIDWDGSTIRVDYVIEGNTPTPPAVSRTGYTFTGWNPTIVAVTGDATYTAQYTINYYTVRFFSDPGVIFDQATLAYGTQLVVRTNPTKQGYIFVRWDPIPTTVTQDQDYYAVWEKIYIVQFLDSDGVSVILSNEYLLGESINIPTPPTKPHYRFTEWTPEVNPICDGDATYTASYQLYSTIDVRFYDFYGNVAKQQNVYIDGIYSNEDLTLKDLELMGIVPPYMPVVDNKSFLEWKSPQVSYSSTDYTLIYKFYSRYIDTILGVDYCDDQLDTLERGIDDHSNNINLHIAEQNDKLNKGDSIVSQLNNIDNSIIDEINLVKAGNRQDSNKLLLIYGQHFDEQFSDLYVDISEFQNELSYINNEHINDLQNIDNRISINEDRMSAAQDKINSYPKHEVMTKDEYQHLPSYDPSIIYFTKET